MKLEVLVTRLRLHVIGFILRIAAQGCRCHPFVSVPAGLLRCRC